MGIKGDHSARRKGDNGTADPKAKAQTYHTKDGMGDRGNSPAEGDHSREGTIVRAG
jgi:hypothetical protein